MFTCCSATGSSPLTRGKPEDELVAGLSDRLIPAHAGKTSTTQNVPLLLRAHPRSRGENTAAAAPMAGPNGSSPLTRGKQTPAIPRFLSSGLIPAHAGKTRRLRVPSSVSPAHPRSRGENARTTHREQDGGGSSPLTRGKRRLRRGRAQRRGLIPAHAGKTLPDLRFYCADRSDLGNP